MDPRTALCYWLDDSDESYEAGRAYNEATARGFFPAIAILNNGETVIVLKVSGGTAKGYNKDGRKFSVKRSDINRVSLY